MATDIAGALRAAAASRQTKLVAETTKIAPKYVYNTKYSHEVNLAKAGVLAEAGKALSHAKNQYVKLNPNAEGADPKRAASTNLAISTNAQRRGGLSPIKGGRPSATTLISDSSTVGKKKNALGTKQYGY